MIMASSQLSLLSFFAIFLSFPTISFSSEPVNPEVKALIAIKNALHDPHGALSNWDEDYVDPCSWPMITCSPLKLVISLEVPSQNLSGTLSSSIGNLTNLQQLFLQSNNISGQLPVELGLLTKLQTLDLSYNRFNGKVPETLGQLRNLRYVRLNSNNLSGTFPTSLSKIPQLSFLDLSYNNLSGPVPQFPARTFNIVGNPLICGNRTTEECSKTITTVSPPLLLQPSTQKRSKTKKILIVIALAVGIPCGLLLVLAVWFAIWWRRKQKNVCVLGRSEREEEGSSMASLGNLRRFTLRELQSATENFNSRNLLGKGGFGHVYKGRLSDGTIVAVKRLRDATSGGTGDSQFKTEVEMISLAIHRNLLRLLGYCATSGERLLIYPFMPNGSVAARLRGKPALNWDTRKRIALGASRGLLYLHEQCDPKIIHRDVKAANVLLDDDCEAVVGDFGLAKLLDHGDSHVTTAVRGTVGHIAPEYLSTGQSSDKTDVFGFGILLLELITGQRSLEFGKSANQKGVVMLDWVRKVYQERKLELLVDRDLGSNYDHIEVGEMVQVALLCTQCLPSNRPKMAEVVRMLEGDGLAEKWEASNRSKLQNDSQNPAITSQNSHSNTFFVIHGDDYGVNSSDEDGHSADLVEEMELSGPR